MDSTIYVKPERIRQYVIDLFGYCIAPINYGGKRSLLDESCGM